MSIALLGLVTAIGLGLIVFVSQQGWPGVLSGPIPAGPAVSGVVHNDPIALTQSAGAPASTPAGDGGTVASVAPSSGGGGVTAGSTGGSSPQPAVSAPTPVEQAVEPSPGATASPPAASPPATPGQPPASPPTAAPVSTPVSTPAVEESSKPVSSGTSKSTGGSGEKSKSEPPIAPPVEWDKSKGYDGGGRGSAPERPKSSSYAESEAPDPYQPSPPAWEGWTGKDADVGYSGEYEESGKDDD